MSDVAIQGNERYMRALPPLDTVPEVRTLRACCADCGAHAAVVTLGASVTGCCSVCGSAALLPMDDAVPPPRRWAQ